MPVLLSYSLHGASFISRLLTKEAHEISPNILNETYMVLLGIRRGSQTVLVFVTGHWVVKNGKNGITPGSADMTKGPVVLRT